MTASAADEVVDGDALTREEVVGFMSVRSISDN
jgi:hypothetical protein